jgi:Holliday junction resolvase RusA-like endonuclease
MTKREIAINNSYQILEEFKQRVKVYRLPLKKFKYRGRSGKPKIYTRKEIENYEREIKCKAREI